MVSPSACSRSALRSAVAPNAAPRSRRTTSRSKGLSEATEREIKVWLLSDALRDLDRRFGPVDDAIVLWHVIQAR